ncbi:LysR substrate-binding domain-containing protein [Uliginosibacterium sp. sgz301328]|uniref:LysR substrate-binding domain-containing protein n=1 Tax=Uliginosibacterium sp. sgz301328 TaxID=3243764 RepID=UPI00359CBE2A
MDIRQLTYFIVVAEEGRISRAATLLNMTQPSLTRHIQALEESVGVQLLQRTTWGVELTAAGRSLLEHARAIRAQIEIATRQARRVAADQFDRIDVGVHGTAMVSVVPRVLERLSARHPHVELVLQSEPKALLTEALREGRILVFFDRYLSESPDIAVELVDREPGMLAVHRDDPLAQCERIALRDLADTTFIEVANKSIERLSLLCQQHGFVPNVRHRTWDIITAVLMVSGGYGATLVPATTVDMQLPNVVYRPIEHDDDLSFLTHCAYRRNETHPMLADLLQAVREHRERRD